MVRDSTSTFCLGFLGLCKWASKIECAVAGGKEENVLLLRNMTENWEMWLNSWLGITSRWDVGLQSGFFWGQGDGYWVYWLMFSGGVGVTAAVWGPSWPRSAPTLQCDLECAESGAQEMCGKNNPSFSSPDSWCCSFFRRVCCCSFSPCSSLILEENGSGGTNSLEKFLPGLL